MIKALEHGAHLFSSRKTPARESGPGLVFVFSGPGDEVPSREGRSAYQL